MELMELADEGFQEGFEKLLESRIHVRMEEVIRTIRSMDCKYCILSHCEPLGEEDLLCYLESIL